MKSKLSNNYNVKAQGLLALAIVSLLSAPSALAKGGESSSSVPATPVAAPADSEMEQVNVDSIKEKYWARGNETELGVVQNRTYSKAGRFELGLLGGFLTSDPFLSVKTYGLELGYHINEYLAIQILGLKFNSKPSAALETFESSLGATTNTNHPKSYLGTEVAASILYGKLSVLGKSIIYYDLHVLGGLGAMSTETGTYVTPSLGIGQRFYVSQHVSIRVDYRMQYFRENLIEKEVTTRLGQSVGTRSNWSNVIAFGVYYMF